MITIAFAGLSGSGKTTMEHIISNNYDENIAPSEGKNIVTINKVVDLANHTFKVIDIAGKNSDEVMN